jgi:NAD(P)-dependent dehydrogenase (short-subunit alcohol dehydrogenase family)
MISLISCQSDEIGVKPGVREMPLPFLPDQALLFGGARPAIGANLARLFTQHGLKGALAARSGAKLEALAAEIGAQVFEADASDPAQVQRLFQKVEHAIGTPDVTVYNASGRLRGPLVELDPAEVERALLISGFGGFLVGQEAARRLLARPEDERGAILFTGASASVKGYARSAPFAMGKFALRGLAQSMARELAPQGIHVGHFVIDGAIRSATRLEAADRPDSMLDPDSIAEGYWQFLQQPRNAWSWEIELRPWVETF